MAIRLSATRLDLSSASLTNAELRGWSETVNALGNVTGATTIDLSLGNVITATTTGSTTWTVTNTSSTHTSSFTLILTNGGSATQTWPSGTTWSQGVAPTLNSSGTDILTFFTTDNATTWRASKGGPTPDEQTGRKLFVWGQNGSGQLGLSDTVKRSSPVQLSGNWKKVAAAGTGTFGIRSNGTLWAWGTSGGILGLGDTVGRSSPVQVGALSDWVDINGCHPDGGASSMIGLRADGTLWMWGSNNYGQLGLGTSGESRSSPVQVPGTWKSLGHNISLQTLAIKPDGSLWAWGWNSQGQLGLGDVARRSSPTQVLGTWMTFACTEPNHPGASNALKADGSLWAWGNNSYAGVLGLGDTVNRYSPVQVPGTWKIIGNTGLGANFSIRGDGSLWAWGANWAYGQLGTTSFGNKVSSPIQIAGTWTAITGGFGTALGMKEAGSLFVWGYSGSGSIGLGDTIRRSSPVQMPGTWIQAFQGRDHMFAMKI